VFEEHPSSPQICCCICDQETGTPKWISRRSAKLHTLWAFSNIIQFSCKNLANQISQNSRLNWIILENARSDTNSQQHQNALSAIQSWSAAQQYNQQSGQAEEALTDNFLLAPTPNMVLHHEVMVHPPIYELTDLYRDNNGDEIVFTAGEEALVASAERRNTSFVDAENFATGELGWDDWEEGDTYVSYSDSP
jgi:hypothetical protein